MPMIEQEFTEIEITCITVDTCTLSGSQMIDDVLLSGAILN